MSLTLTTEERNLPISLCVSLNPLETRKRERETEKEREREREREVSTALWHQLPLSIICLLRLEVKAV